jgi:tyrosine-specific transport protein
MKKHSQLIGGILLVSGTTIGAGMLALPIITGFAGFIPSVLLLIVFWAYMTYTAFLVLETNLWMEKDTNLMTMASRTLGRPGEVLSWLVYLFLLYSLTTAYIAGSGPIVIDFVKTLTGYQPPLWSGSIPLLVIFGFFVYRGTKTVDYANRVLMFGLVIAYGLLLIFLTPHVQPALLAYTHWRDVLVAVSVVATSFGFHIIIPSLTTYMDGNVKRLKKTILIGSAIPLLVYIVWEALTLGIIPLNGANSITEGYQQGSNGAYMVSMLLKNSVISQVARFFAFFAIVTSFLGVSLSLLDFLADGLAIKKNPKGRALLYALTFGPPLVITLYDPRAFISALEYAGAFGVVVLLGLLPALMVWSGRYRKGYVTKYTTPGGKLALVIVIILSLAVVGLEIANKTEFMQEVLELK